MEDEDIVHEFVVESNASVARLDRELDRLGRCPADASLLAGVFRTFHNVKGPSGMLGFHVLEKVARAAERPLGHCRDGSRSLTPDLISLILRAVDSVKKELVAIESTGSESGDLHTSLCHALQAACERPAERNSSGSGQEDNAHIDRR